MWSLGLGEPYAGFLRCCACLVPVAGLLQRGAVYFSTFKLIAVIVLEQIRICCSDFRYLLARVLSVVSLVGWADGSRWVDGRAPSA